MSDTNHKPHPDTLEQATAAVRDAAVPAGPPAELVAATVAALNNRVAAVVPTEPARNAKWRRIMRYTGYGIGTAAAVALAVFGVVSLGGRAIAFERVVEKVKQAESVTFTETQTLGDQKPIEMKFAVRGPNVRIDAGATVLIFDTKAKTGVMLVPQMKSFRKLEPAQIHGPAGKSPIDDLLALRGRKAEAAGEEKVNGVACQKLTVKGDPKADAPGDWVLWIDPKTELPVQMTCTGRTIAGDKDVAVTKVYEKFVWNAKLDDKLFDQTAPAGYAEGLPGEAPKKPEPAESDATVFIHAITEAEKAKSVTATATAVTDGKVTYSRKVIRAGDGIRAETTRAEKAAEVVIADLKTGDAIVRDEKAKTAHTTKLGGQELQMLNGLLVDFAGMKESLAKDANAVKPAGEDKIGGRATKVYDVTSKQPGVVWKVWIDPTTDLPVRAKFADGRKGWPTFTIDFDGWNTEYDAKLFNRDLPAGFKLVEPKK